MAFNNCNGFTGYLIIPNSVTSIGMYAFNGCNNLTNITIGNSMSSIGVGAFENCSGLEQVLVASGNAYYDSREDCNALIRTSTNELIVGCKNTVIPSSVTSIGNRAFCGCSGLNSIEIPNSVNTIGNSVFLGCIGLEQILVASDNTVFDSRENCNAIIISNTNELTIGCKNTIIPSSVTSIGVSAFDGCIGLTSLEIPNSVTSIGNSAFYCCNGLISIEIPNSVTSIGSYAYAYCSGITSMTVFAATPPTLGNVGYYSGSIEVFTNVDKSIPVYVPYGTISAYQTAPGWSEFTNYQEMPIPSISQTFNLAADWNWWSPSINITLADFEAALGGNGWNIVSQEGFTASYSTFGWGGSLQSIEAGKMYMVQTNAACSVTVSGTAVNPAEHPITLYHGTNWIGFIGTEAMSLNEAFAGFTPTNLDNIKTVGGTATYYQGLGWRGSLSTLEPGKGYIYKSNATESRTFTYPSAK